MLTEVSSPRLQLRVGLVERVSEGETTKSV